VGSGITGGWAAKELTERGLRVLMLDRGRMVRHGKDYPTEHIAPWEIPDGGKPQRALYASDYPVQSTSYAFNETSRHFWNNDRLNPYVQDSSQFNWLRGDQVGGRSLTWANQCYRWSDLDFEANRETATASTGRSAIGTWNPGTAMWSDLPASAAKPWTCHSCPTASSNPPWP